MAAPLVPLVLAWMAGLLVGERLPLGWQAWLLWGAVVASMGWRAWARQSPRSALSLASPFYAALVVLALLGGAARGAAHRPRFDATDLAAYNDLGEVQVRGMVVRYPEARGSATRYEIAVQELATGEGGERRQVSGRLLASLPPYPPFHYGDEVALSGELVTPPVLEDFDYRAFLAHKGIYSLLRQGHGRLVATGRGSPLFHLLFGIRQRAEQSLQRILPEPHASLMSGILLGIESGIPDDVKEAFNTTGTTHVLVISGSNFAILAAIFLFLGRRALGERRGTLLAVVAIALYALLVGGDPPVLRAAIMGTFTLVALLLRRETVALNTLALALWLMTAAQPGQLYDVGFQLSALATLGLVLFVAPLTGLTDHLLARYLPLSQGARGRLLGILSDALLITLAAQLITTPLIVGTFGRFSLVSLLTNLLILPVQGWLLASGALAALAGMLWLPLGRLLAALPYAALAWTVAVVRWTATLPYASVAFGPFPTWSIWAFYGLAGAGWWLRESGRHEAPPPPKVAPAPAPPLARRQAVRWGGALLAALLPWWVAAQQPDGRLHLYALDIGQGDALLIVAPDGKQLLVDGGPDPVPLLARLGDRMPPWDRTIELVVLSHADADHLGGLPELLGRYRVAEVMDSGHGHETALYGAWVARLAEQGLVPRRAVPGQRWQLGKGAWVEVLAPLGEPFDSLNNNAVVMRLQYGHFCALLTGDIEAEAEARLVRDGQLGPCQVLKVAHHGSHTSSIQPLLDAVHPTYALVSVGQDNRFGHPHADVLARFAALGSRVLRTDQQGTIHLATDGQQVWVETER